MKRIVLFLAITFLFYSQCYAVVNIDSATIDGNIITITGSGFGTKTPAGPICYDNFDSGTLDENVLGNQTSDGQKTWGATHYSGTYSNEQAVSGTQSNRFRYDESESRTLVNNDIDITDGTEFYMFYKYYLSPSTEAISTATMKMFYFRVSVNDFASGAAIIGKSVGGTYLAFGNNGGAGIYLTGSDMEDYANTWTTFQAYSKLNDVGSANGVYKAWINGNQYWESSSLELITEEQLYSVLSLGTQYQMLADGDGGTAYYYFDNFYLDNTQARVLIDNGGQPDIVIPTSWSDTEIVGTTTGLTTGTITVFDNAGLSDELSVSSGSQQASTQATVTGTLNVTGTLEIS